MSLTKATYSMISGAPANVLDYGADPSGATDSSAAFTAAVRSGAKRVTIPAPNSGCQYKLESAVDMTNLRGITVECLGSLFNGDTGYLPILIAHSGFGFDCTGAMDCEFINVGIEGSTTIPVASSTGWFLARKSSAASAGRHRFFNCRARGYFRYSVLYNYASEENDHYSCFFINGFPGGRSITLTCSNVQNLTSTFETVATGVQSTTQLNFFGGSFYAEGNGGTGDEACFYLEGIGDLGVYSPFFYCPHGLASIYVDQYSSGTTSGFVILNGARFEVSASLPMYCVYFSGTGSMVYPALWSIKNCRMPVDPAGYGIYAEDNTTISSFAIENVQSPTGLGILSYKQLQKSFINYGDSVVVARSGSTTIGAKFIGIASGLTIPHGSETNNSVDQTDAWVSWTPDISALTITGTPTVSASYKRSGNTVTYKILLSSTTSIVCTAGTQILNSSSTTLPGPSVYDGGSVSVANETTGIAVGLGAFKTNTGVTGISLPAISVLTNEIVITATAQTF